MTFWEHLDELRKVLIRIAVWTLVFTVGAFVCKNALFGIVLAPNSPDFVTYRLVNVISGWLSQLFSCGIVPYEAVSVKMISTNLTTQFIVHLRMAFCAGLLIVSPYVIFMLFGFVAPGLYNNERRCVRRVAVWAWVAFWGGLLLSYFVIFPFSLQFLGRYQVSSAVTNMFTINSYVDIFVLLGVMMGTLFELPVVAWLLAELGLLRSETLRRYRRHAIMLVVVLAAIITPTTDVFTLMLASCPIYLLYEVGVWVVSRVERRER